MMTLPPKLSWPRVCARLCARPPSACVRVRARAASRRVCVVRARSQFFRKSQCACARVQRASVFVWCVLSLQPVFSKESVRATCVTALPSRSSVCCPARASLVSCARLSCHLPDTRPCTRTTPTPTRRYTLSHPLRFVRPFLNARPVGTLCNCSQVMCLCSSVSVGSGCVVGVFCAAATWTRSTGLTHAATWTRSTGLIHAATGARSTGLIHAATWTCSTVLPEEMARRRPARAFALAPHDSWIYTQPPDDDLAMH